jgi:hypothetical protein
MALLAGCGGAAPPPVAPVSGVVTIDGQPAGNLSIQFQPEKVAEGTVAMGAFGVSDAQGKFELKSQDGRAGAALGSNSVVVFDKNLESEGEPQEGVPVKVVPNRVHPIYSAATTTPVKVTVAEGTTGYEIKLLSRPPEAQGR